MDNANGKDIVCACMKIQDAHKGADGGVASTVEQSKPK
ncbi:hypothetical protein SSCHL_1187 [Staphylococcus schleiferi]|nr:hypothetical protein SSCHL_1187 [Staphylococcus schleiferi]